MGIFQRRVERKGCTIVFHYAGDFNHHGNFTATHKLQQPGLIVNLQLLAGL